MQIALDLYLHKGCFLYFKLVARVHRHTMCQQRIKLIESVLIADVWILLHPEKDFPLVLIEISMLASML